MNMFDLFYGPIDKAFFLSIFPDTKFKDASDFIHEDRTQVEMEVESLKEYYLILLRNKLASQSLNLRLAHSIPGVPHETLKDAFLIFQEEKTSAQKPV